MIDFLLVAVDLDGTLLTSAGTLASESARLLTQVAQKGVRVVVVTTRNLDSARPFCSLLGIGNPIICSNGAHVLGSPGGPVWAYHTIPKEVALTIARWADSHDWELSTTIGSMTYWRRRPGQQLGPIAPNITIVATNADAITDEPLRILTWQLEAVDGIRSLCESRFPTQCRVETYYESNGSVHSLGVFAPHATKGDALALVLNRLNIGRESALAIGDNFNDLPMFACAKLSVAMANAPDPVKQRATVVAPSNDEEGVAWALKTYFDLHLMEWP